MGHEPRMPQADGLSAGEHVLAGLREREKRFEPSASLAEVWEEMWLEARSAQERFAEWSRFPHVDLREAS